jgi:hypothetical protein
MGLAEGPCVLAAQAAGVNAATPRLDGRPREADHGRRLGSTPGGAAMRFALLALALAGAALPAFAHEPQPAQTQLGHDPADCYCRAQGKTFAVGETVCLRTSEGPRMAQCGMVLNNTSWRFTERPCPES